MDYYNIIYTYLAILAALKWTSSTTGQPDNTTPAHKYPSAVHSQQQCVCKQHNDLPIYERPSTHSIPIGNMYHGDCKLYYQQQYHTAAFLPVLHYHQVGYVINDSNTNVNPCPNFVTEKEDKQCDDSYGTCSTVEVLDDSCGNTCTQVEDHIVPEKVACNAGENSKSSTIENSRKRKTAIKSPSTDVDEVAKLCKLKQAPIICTVFFGWYDRWPPDLSKHLKCNHSFHQNTNFNVTVSDSRDDVINVGGKLGGTYFGPGIDTDPFHLTITCSNTLYGKFLKIKHKLEGHMGLCEVFVYTP